METKGRMREVEEDIKTRGEGCSGRGGGRKGERKRERDREIDTNRREVTLPH